MPTDRDSKAKETNRTCPRSSLTDVIGTRNRHIRHNAVCLETQHFPDAINQHKSHNFPSVILHPSLRKGVAVATPTQKTGSLETDHIDCNRVGSDGAVSSSEQDIYFHQTMFSFRTTDSCATPS